MKKTILLLLLSFSFFGTAQKITLKKGVVIDGLKVADTISETFALYLPTTFETTKKWPVLFVYDIKGRGRSVVSMFSEAAERQGFILAASNHIRDSLSLSKNVLISSRMFNTVFTMVPIQKNRVYTGGYAESARLASLMPTFIKQVKGVISCGSPVANTEVLSSKNPFHFIGIVGVDDYNYIEMLATEKVLKSLRFPNHFLPFQGGQEWPKTEYINRAMELLNLTLMAKGELPKDEVFIEKTYRNGLGEVSSLITEGRPLLANRLLNEMIESYRPLRSVDSLKSSSKTLSRSKQYRSANRSLNSIFFRESLIKEDYVYYLEEDVLTYNYNNLGWWKYQMEKLEEYEKNPNSYEKQMGRRLKGYLNALIADNIDIINAETPVDEEALNFLWMLNTITDAKSYQSYLNVISYSAKIEDYGTALFYLEELLKNGFTDQEVLYTLEHTALFRIMPEFNKVVAKYLKDARYDVIEE
jgi:hypothetical protein